MGARKGPKIIAPRREQLTRTRAQEVAAVAARLPVAVITGFLGSGKTTLLSRLLKDPTLAETAVIVNEFGEVGLDHFLVEAPKDETVLLNNGCLCCAILGDLVMTLASLIERRDRGELPPFKRVVVETTGLADPAPILHTVLTDPVISRRFVLDSVVTVVDAVNGAGQLDAHFESVKQAAVADRLVISKIDLAKDKVIAALRKRIRAFNPGAALFEAVKGAVPAKDLLGHATAFVDPAAFEAWLQDRAYDRDDRDRHGRDGKHPHDNSIRTFTIYRDAPVRAQGLSLWLEMLSAFRGPNLLRVKGLLNVEGKPVVVQAVQHLFHEPTALKRWPTADRRSRVVFITKNLARADVERTFSAFDFDAAPSGRAGKATIDPRSYENFVAVMQQFGGNGPATSSSRRRSRRV